MCLPSGMHDPSPARLIRAFKEVLTHMDLADIPFVPMTVLPCEVLCDGVSVDHIAPAEAVCDDDSSRYMANIETVISGPAVTLVPPLHGTEGDVIGVTDEPSESASSVTAPVSAPIPAARSVFIAPPSIAVGTVPPPRVVP